VYHRLASVGKEESVSIALGVLAEGPSENARLPDAGPVGEDDASPGWEGFIHRSLSRRMKTGNLVDCVKAEKGQREGPPPREEQAQSSPV
jgi:hypothetical protein